MPTVKFDDLMDTFLLAGFVPHAEASAYISREDGKIYVESDEIDQEEPLPDDLGDPERYVVVPNKNDLDLGRRLVMRFVERELPDSRDEVDEFFRRRGAYSRFKALLDEKEKLEKWYEFEQAETESALKEWCEEEGIDLET